MTMVASGKVKWIEVTAAWAAWFVEEVAREVPHRHVVVTLPKLLRPFFKFDRSLLTDLARWVYESLHELMAPLADVPVRPGCVAVLELAGNLLNLQPLCGAPHKGCYGE